MPHTSQLDPKRYFTENGWALLDQCEVTDGPVPYWIKLAALRNNNMLAFFVGSEAAPSLPTNIDIGNDHLPDMLATDLLIQGKGYNSDFQQYFDARFNPIQAQKDNILCIMFGGRYYMARRSSPPSNDPIIEDQNATSIVPKDRVITADLCRAGGNPCVPALDIQAGLPTNWQNKPVGPVTLLPFPINYGNGKLSKLPLSVNFAPCCTDDVNVSLIDPHSGVTFIETSAGGQQLQDGYVSPTAALISNIQSQTFNIWLDYDSNALLPFVDVDGYYTFTIRFTTVNCGIYVATLKAPISAQGGGYIQLLSFVKI